MKPKQTITQVRERLGLSPEELGRAIGIDDTWDLEMHDDELAQILSLAELNRLCEVLHLSPYELLERPSPQRHITPSELRVYVLESCRCREWTADQFGDEVGWDVQGLIDAPTDYLLQLNLNGLQDICWHLGINPLEAIPLPAHYQGHSL